MSEIQHTNLLKNSSTQFNNQDNGKIDTSKVSDLNISVEKPQLDVCLIDTSSKKDVYVSFNPFTDSMQRKLDDLLKRASVKSYGAVSARELHAAVFDKAEANNALVNLPLYKNAEVARKKAETTLKNLDKYTGISDYKNMLNPDKSSGKAVMEAIDAQLKLADELNALIQDENYQDDKAALSILRFKCNIRANEISVLASQLQQIGENLDRKHWWQRTKEEKALVSQKASELLPSMAGGLDGTKQAMEHLKGKLAPLMQRLADIENNPAHTSIIDLERIRTEVSEMKTALLDAAQNGITLNKSQDDDVPTSRIFVDPTLLKSLTDLLDEGMGNILNFHGKVLSKVLQRTVNAEMQTPLLDFFATQSHLLQPPFSQVLEHYKTLKKSIQDFCKKPSEESLTALQTNIGILRNALKDENCKPQRFRDACEALYDTQEFKDALPLFCRQRKLNLKATKEDIKTAMNIMDKKGELSLLSYGFPCLETQVQHLVRTYDGFQKLAKQNVDNKTLQQVFDGKLPFSELAELRTYGILDDDVDTTLTDDNLKHSAPLGRGARNTVFVCKYKIGTQEKNVVFKPELPARNSLFNCLPLGKNAYDSSQQDVAKLNIATSKCAEFLGIQQRVVKTKAGFMNKQLGFFMEQAKGLEGEKFKKELDGDTHSLEALELFPNSSPDTQLFIEHKAECTKQLMKQTCELQWLDLITGQGDRHGNNYMIHLSPSPQGGTPKVIVQGIDNDACFSQNRIGIHTYKLSQDRLNNLYDALEKNLEYIYRPRSLQLTSHLKILKEELNRHITQTDDHHYVIDILTIDNPILILTLQFFMGFHSGALPSVIPQHIYNKLELLNNDDQTLQNFKNMLKPYVNSNAIEATEKRLKELWNHAQKLQRQKKVMKTDEDWQQASTQKPSFKPKTAKDIMPYIIYPTIFNNNNIINLLTTATNRTKCPDYFHRDLSKAISKL